MPTDSVAVVRSDVALFCHRHTHSFAILNTHHHDNAPAMFRHGNRKRLSTAPRQYMHIYCALLQLRADFTPFNLCFNSCNDILAKDAEKRTATVSVLGWKASSIRPRLIHVSVTPPYPSCSAWRRMCHVDRARLHLQSTDWSCFSAGSLAATEVAATSTESSRETVHLCFATSKLKWGRT